MAEPWKDYASAAPAASDGPWSSYAKRPTVGGSAPTSTAVTRPKVEPSSIVRRVVGDSAVDLGKGIIGVGEAAVGLANIPTFGAVGKGLEAVGYDPATAKKMLEEGYTPERVEANRKVAEAKGFVGTAAEMIKNPSTIAGSIVESAPSMVGGGAIARGLGTVGGMVARPVLRAAIGEGAVGAGSAAEQTRQQTDDGMLSPGQVAASIGSGVGTGLLALAGGAAARRLGIGDVDVALAGGQTVTRPTPNIVRRALEGAVSEGLLEEMPQSMQEQAWQNLATGKPLGEGVLEAGAQGALTGGAMGGTFSAASRPHVENANQEGDTGVARPKVVSPATGQVSDLPDAANGPLSAAVNTAAATGAIPTAAGRAAEPNAPLFEGAQPGSLADAGNAIPRAGKPQNEDMFKRQHAEQLAVAQAHAAAQPQVDPSTGEILTPLGEDGRPARTSRWLDEAGVPRKPTDAELGDFLHETIDAMGSPPSVDGKTMFAAARAEDGALDAKQLHRVLRQVWAERRLAAEAQSEDLAPVARASNLETNADEREAEVGTGRLPGQAAAAADLRAGEAGGSGETATLSGQADSAQTEALTAPVPRGQADLQAAEPPANAADSAKTPDAPAEPQDYPEPGERAARQNLRAGLSRTDTASAQDAPTATDLQPARAPLNVRMGGNEYPVESYEDASRKFNELKGKVDVGGMPVVELVDQGGKPVGYLGQGGEVYEGNFQEQRLKPGRQEPVYRPPSGEALPNPAVIEGQATRVAPEAAGAETQGVKPETQAQRGEALVPARDTSPVAAAAATAATSPANDLPEPTDAQKEAGNYQKGHVRVAGMDISIENPAGSKRRPEWPALKHHYGYIRGTIGKDKDHVDVFLTDNAEDTSRPVFVVDQIDPKTGKFDEHKVVLGAADEAEARAAYAANYSKDWKGLRAIKQFSQDEFKAWVRDADATKKPAAGRTAQIQEVEPPSSESGSAQIGESAPPSVNTLVGRIADGEHTTKVLQGLDDKTARAVAVAMGHRFAKTAKAGNIISNLEAKSQPDLRRAAARAFEIMATPEEKAQLEASRPARSKAYNEKVRTEEQNIALRQRERRDGTLARDNGEPFKNQTAAARALSELPESGEFARDGFGLFKTEGGFVLRRWETTGTGAIDSGWVDQKEAIRRRESARADTAAKQGLVVDKFGNMVTPEEAARIDEVFDDYGEPRPGYDENGNKTAETATEPDNAAKPADAHDARWDAMTAAQREDVLKQDAGWGTAPGAKMALNPTGRKIAARAWADQVEGTRATIARLMDRQPATGKIVDLGEKIGGARKDTAVKTGSKGKSLAVAKDTRPTWAKRYEIAQIAKSMNPEEEGRWAISDSRRKDYLGQPVRPTRQTFATREEAEKALPLLELARQHRAVSRGDGFAIVRDVTDRKRVVLKEGFASRDEAVRYMAEHATELLETVTSVGEEALPLPDDVARTGPARRTGNVDGNDFLETFGFRGVEFGNWNNQVERQEVMNHAFDGLHDMAEILGIPPKAISLNGELALAFGARGHGLSGARAHYEPVRGVINLTKMQGAGALAHEWLHALDHYLGRQAGTARRERTRSEDGGQLFKDADADQFLSHNGWARHGDQMRAELRAAFKNVMDTISTKAEAYVEDTKQAERFLGHARDQLAQRLSEIRANLARKADWGKKTAPASAEQLAEIDEITRRLLDGKDLETRLIDTGKKAMPRGSLAHLRNSNDSLERLNAIMKTVRGRQGFNSEQRGTLDYLRYEMANYATRIKALNDAKGETTKTRKMPTSFRMEAIKADQGRATNYWATPHELAARAFSAYVEDKLDERGIGSNFLSYGSEHRFVLPIPEFPRPFPGGKEREAINAAFDAFFREVKTREEGGKVALYSRAGRAGSDRAGWADFPAATIAHPFAKDQRRLGQHPDYAAAKAGDEQAALRVAADFVGEEMVQAVRTLIGDRKPALVPVLAQEATGNNQLPLAFAYTLADALGLQVDTDIVQSVRAHHTNASAFHRIGIQAAFDGPVNAGADYLVLDDQVTMGGTLANLRGHIEANGGRVIGAAVLTGHPNGATIALQPATAQRLRETFGDDLDTYLQEEFGFDSTRLTEGEAGHILAARTLDAVRDRIAQARLQAFGQGDGRALRSQGRGEVAPAVRRGLDFERATALKQQLTAKWGENAPRVVLVEDATGLAAAARAAGYRLSAADVDRVEGMYLGKPTVWLNLAEIPTAERFREVLTHEALGHYGVEQVLGKAEWASITQAIDQHVKNGTGAQDLRDAIAQLRRTQPDIFDSAETVAKEVIAVMAERGSRNGLVQRVIAGIRRFLRRLMPEQRWTDSEIRDLIHQADRFMHAGRTNEQQQARTRALAFSRAEEQSSEIEADTAFVAGLTEKERNAPAMVSFARAMYADLGTNSPFFQDWFGDSKVVDKSGAPAVAYHGTGEEFAAFDPQRLGKSTNHLTAALGIFFDTRRAKAEHYARVATNDVPADQVILEGYLAIEKPYAMSKDEFMAVDSIERAREIRARLEKEGYDGIQLPEVGQWIAFKPEQFKRTDNRGTFNSGDARMLFSKAPAEAIDSIEQQVREVDAEVEGDRSILGRARAALKAAVPDKVKDATRTSWLGALALRHLVELGSDYFPTMRIYGDFLKQMEADRNQLQQEGEDVAEAARKWAGKNLPEADRTFDLMHDATIAGVDPAEDYQPLQFRQGGKMVEVNKKNVTHHLKILREQMRGRGGDSKKNILDEAKGLRAMLAAEPKRKATYPALVARWNALSPEAKAHYVAMRDLYAKRSEQTEAALIQRIKDLKMEGGENHKRALITTIRHQFETQRLQGVYFPLQRFGRYFVAAEKEGVPTFQMFESINALETAVKGLRARGFTIKAQGLKSDGKAKDAPSGTFVAEVLQMLNKAGVSDQTQDQIYQLYLQALPELSMRKHSIHRKSVIGFDPDAIRGFAFNMQHGAHQLARLRYAHKLQDTITVLQEQQNAARKEPDADTRKIAAGDAVLSELDKRHEWISNPTDSKLTNLVSSFGFAYYLGLTPAAALVNLTQTALITYPYLAARFGPVKAMNHLLRGMSGSAKRLGHIDKDLAGDELRAHRALQAMGALDKTQTHNLAGIAEGGLAGYNPKWAKAMEIIGWGFHKTEVINREATGMAAFRLATEDGKSFDEAVKIAADAIHDTHYDYSNANRARFMQSGTAKVLLMFRQYSLNTTWHLGRMVWNATKGADPEVKRIARRNLTGILGMSALFSGALGLPLASVTMGVLNAIAASAGGGDDEPWDAETEFRKFLQDMFGAGVASAILGGVVNPLTGADIASRVSFSQLWFRDADRELDGRGAYYNLLEQAAGPMGGVLKNALVGKQLMDEGHLMRGVETVLPKSLKDGLKAARYASQGVNNLRGDPIVEDLSARQMLLQLAGFTPAEVADRYDRNRALKNYEQHVLDRRQSLVDAVALAVRTGDADGRREALASIRAFNQKWPEIAITPKTLKRSLASRARYSQQAENGIMLNKKIAARVREQVGA